MIKVGHAGWANSKQRFQHPYRSNPSHGGRYRGLRNPHRWLTVIGWRGLDAVWQQQDGPDSERVAWLSWCRHIGL